MTVFGVRDIIFLVSFPLNQAALFEHNFEINVSKNYTKPKQLALAPRRDEVRAEEVLKDVVDEGDAEGGGGRLQRLRIDGGRQGEGARPAG